MFPRVHVTRLFACILGALIIASAYGVPHAQMPQPYLVKDINTQPRAQNPGSFLVVGTKMYLTENDVATGTELWRTDGTLAGTAMVKDVNPGTASSSPTRLTNVNGTLFFFATSPGVTVGLWRTDGTEAGTVFVKALTQFPSNTGSVNGKLLFDNDNGTNGSELWISDGTAAGTVMLKDIRTGSGGSFPQKFTTIGGTAYFSAVDGVTGGTNGGELWKTDGTNAGTVLVKDINVTAAAQGAQLDWLTDVNGTLFFYAYDGGPTGWELWKSNGTAASTVIVKDILPGSGGSAPQQLTNVNGTLFFVAHDGTFDRELWKSDGTSAGTVLVKNINPIDTSSAASLTNVNGTLFFTATDGSNGIELWRSNGTAAGTVLVKDINPGFADSSPGSLTNLNGTLLFAATDTTNGRELWRSDGTTAGTTILVDLNAGSPNSTPQNLTNFNGTLLFSAFIAGSGNQLWRSNGTVAGTVAVQSIVGSANSTPFLLLEQNGSLFFGATGANGNEPWRSDGTSAGTTMLADLNPFGGSLTGSAVNANGTVFFTAQNPTVGTELWRTDGTAAGTVLVADIAAGADSGNPLNLAYAGGKLYFSAFDVGNINNELWKTDGTAVGTVRVKDIFTGNSSSSPASFTDVNGTVFFAATDSGGRELFRTDGTATGTVRVKDINPGSVSSNPTSLVNANGVLYFSATDTNGQELWKSDGSTGGTVLVRDISSGAPSSSPALLTHAGGGVAFFIATDSTSGRELWKTDGTLGGTVLVKDINPGAASSNPSQFILVNGTLFFRADNGTNGFELWRSDGTAGGTVLVKDINPGAGQGAPGEIAQVDGKLFFQADDGVNGFELWQSDGTQAGTVMVMDINPGSGGSNPRLLTNVNGRLFFAAYDGLNGVELWALNSAPLPQTISVTIPAPASAAYDTTFDVAATASSGLDVAIAVDPANVCSVIAGGFNTATVRMESGTGICTVHYTQAGDATHDAAPEVTSTTTASRINPAVTFTGAPASAIFGETFEVASSTESTAVPAYTSSGACSNTGTSYTMTSGAGICTATVTWAADSNYNGAMLTQDTVAGLGAQSIDFAPLGNLTYGAAAFTLTATGGASGNPVVFNSTTPTVCTTTGTNGTLATIVGAGACSITASQAGNDNYGPATDVTQGFNVAKAGSTTAVTGGSFVYDGNPHGGMVLVSGAGTGITQTVSWSYSGSCSAAPVTVPQGASCVARADYAGDANHEASFGVAAITITKASATTTISCPVSVVYTGAALTPCTVSVTGAGGLSLNPTPHYFDNVDAGVDVAGVSYTFFGDDNHTGSFATKSFTILKASSTTAVTGGSFQYDGNPHGGTSLVSGVGTGITQTVSWSYSGSCSVAPTTVAEGTACVARADYAGDDNHDPSFGTAAVTITPASSTTTVTFEAGPYTYRGTAFTATASVSGVNLSQTAAVVYSGDCLNVTAANGCTASATFAGDDNHTGSNGTASITLSKAVALVSITPFSGTYDGAAHGLSGSATGVGGAILNAGLHLGDSFTNVPGGTATWTFAGGANYTDQTGTAAVDIAPAGSTTTVTFEAGPHTYRGTAFEATATVSGANLSQQVTVSYSGDCLNVTVANGCTATATFAGDDNHTGSSGSASITLGKAVALVSITPFSGGYDGNAHGLTGSATGVGGANLDASLDLGASFTNVPGGTATWTFTGGANYTNQTGTGAVNISPAGSTTTVTFEAGPYTFRGTPFTATASVSGANLSGPVAVVYSGDCLNVTVANGCTATATFAGDDNHTSSSGSASITLGQAVALVTITPFSGAFNGIAHGLSGSATGVGGADLSANLDLGETFTSVPGGTANWTFNGGANYTNQNGSAAVTITPAGSTTTVTFEPGPYPYRGSAYLATATVSGSGLSQTVPVTYSGDCVNVTTSNGCTASATFAGDGNHTGSTGSASITVGKAVATVTITPYAAPYDGSAHGLQGTATGVGGVDLSASLSLGASFTDAPGGTATWVFTGGANYTDQSGTGGVTITPVASTTTVTFEPGPYVYRGTPFVATATVTGLNLSQSVPVVYSGDCLHVTSPNGCTATASFTGDVNHTSSNGSASVTIGQRSITVTAQPNTKVADGTTTAAAVPLVTSGTLAAGDTGHFVETYDTAAVGTNKTLTPSGTITNAGAANVTGSYAITFVPNTEGVITAPPAGYDFSGFFAPIDMPATGGPVVLNSAKAGQAIPAKWRLVSGGVPVSDPTSFAGLFSYQVNCASGSAIEDPIEEYATGSSSLQYKGDGNWQFNWNTPASYKNTCRVMNIKLKDGTYSPGANFKFK